MPQGGELLGELKHEQICSDPEVCRRDGVFRGDHASVTEMSLRCHCPDATVVTAGGPHAHASSSIARRGAASPRVHSPSWETATDASLQGPGLRLSLGTR